MGERHKHADVIIAWAEGKEIEVFHSNVGWINYAPLPNKQPAWDLNSEYRIKPHKFQDVIDAYLRGETVQYYTTTEWNSGWMDLSRSRNLSVFDNGDEYRIKPKPDIVKHCHIHLNSVDNIKISSTPFDIYNVQFTFDGVTQELKSVELIK